MIPIILIKSLFRGNIFNCLKIYILWALYFENEIILANFFVSIIAQDDNLRHYPKLLYNISDKGIYTNDTD